MVDFPRRSSPITKSSMLKFRPGEALNPDGQTFGIRSWYGNYIAVINFVCVVSFKRFPFYVRSYDALELRNALEYARRMVRLLFDVELRALHSDVFSSYYNYSVIAEWRALNNIVLDMQPPEMNYMAWLVESSNKHIMPITRRFMLSRDDYYRTRSARGSVVACSRTMAHSVSGSPRTGKQSRSSISGQTRASSRCTATPLPRLNAQLVTTAPSTSSRCTCSAPAASVLSNRVVARVSSRSPPKRATTSDRPRIARSSACWSLPLACRCSSRRAVLSYMQTRSNSPTRTRLVRPASRSNGMRANRRPNSFPLWRGGWGALSAKVAWANHAASVAYVR